MAEYEVEFNSSLSHENPTFVLDMDTATIVSITSSCVILISGCIAVICLILYMKKTDQNRINRNRTCAKCSTIISSTESSRAPIRSESLLLSAQEVKSRPSLALLRGQSVSETQPVVSQPVIRHSLPAIKGRLPDIKTETNPYAISDFDDKTFSGIIGEPKDYAIKSGPHEHYSKAQQCHSQCSSNHEELIRAYEFGRQRRTTATTTTTSCFDEDDDGFYRSSDREDTPTDPGIREFTKSPPKSGERRQGIVFHSNNAFESQLLSQDKSLSNSSEEEEEEDLSHLHFGAIPRDRSRKPSWKLNMNAPTMKSSSLLVYNKDCFGLSSDETEEENTSAATENNKFKFFNTRPENEIDC